MEDTYIDFKDVVMNVTVLSGGWIIEYLLCTFSICKYLQSTSYILSEEKKNESRILEDRVDSPFFILVETRSGDVSSRGSSCQTLKTHGHRDPRLRLPVSRIVKSRICIRKCELGTWEGEHVVALLRAGKFPTTQQQ